MLHVFMGGFMPKDSMSSAQERMDRVREILSADIGEPIVLEVGVIPVEFVQIRSEPEELRKAVIKPKEAAN
jgi:hypothetical protein